ncbi:MAG TPA: FkbM family methyltransferase, partial [Caulobacteraceae bacterium]|nr:FkbM family methyltransferase [Caulobacteraceae bacterium]
MRLTFRQRASWLAHLYKACTQQHHQALRPLLSTLLPIDGVVFDIGAHAGQFAKLFGRMVPHGRVYAFEPSTYAWSILTKALAFNHLTNVTLVPAGLSDRAQEAVLHTPLKASSAWGFGTAHLGGGNETHAADQTISLMRLDDFAEREGLPRLDFIKADIEGWEMRALCGGEATLKRYRPALMLEVDDAMMVRAGDTPAALFAWL